MAPRAVDLERACQVETGRTVTRVTHQQILQRISLNLLCDSAPPGRAGLFHAPKRVLPSARAGAHSWGIRSLTERNFIRK
jgi:hypothetical protein